ncbi:MULTISPECIES: LCP family protein [Clostridium]|uniref:Transcriptional attenuator, LytR family n=1 Tax=Clostridium intestinale DSM 6191 TaxID=1121320 RepID=A0A1M5XJH5_9CLOT|nr:MULTISPECIES: LCP family protein [Clostridium]SHH99698.1 transcriptional attenuator, LytR family [Clostridium intestinale DSM 6191]
MDNGEEYRNKKKKAYYEKQRKRRLMIMSGVLTAIIAAIVFTVIYFYNFFGKFSTDGVSVAPNEVKAKEPVNILVLGLDIGDVNQKDNESIKRTDTIMVLHYEPKNNAASLISVPRDMLIKVNKKNNKINAAYAIGGEKLIQSEVEKLIEADINYIVKIDYEGFRALVDAVGGVEMYIERNMYYDDDAQDLHIRFNKGETVLLDGKKAEEFFRWRKNNDGTGFANGDLDRIENQHKFINKLIEKCTSPAIITNIKGILDVLPAYVKTNMSPSKIISYGLGLKDLDKSNVTTATLQGDLKTIGGASYVVYNRNMNIETLGLLSGSEASNGTIKKKNLRINILNGTRITGLASRMSENLKTKGYSAIDTGNTQERSKTIIKTNNKEMGKLIVEDLGTGTIQDLDDNPQGYDAVILIGSDYKE